MSQREIEQVKFTHDDLDSLEAQEKTRDLSQQNPRVLELIDAHRLLISPAKVSERRCAVCQSAFPFRSSHPKQTICTSRECRLERNRQWRVAHPVSRAPRQRAKCNECRKMFDCLPNQITCSPKCRGARTRRLEAIRRRDARRLRENNKACKEQEIQELRRAARVLAARSPSGGIAARLQGRIF